MPGGFACGPDLCNANDNGSDTANSRGTAVAGANGAYGSYVQLVASTASDACAMCVFIGSSSSNQYQNIVRIAIGASGSEKVIIPDLLLYSPEAGVGAAQYFVPVHVPAGTRIAAAAWCPGFTDPMYVSVMLLDGSYTHLDGYSGVDSMGQTAAKGTAITCGAANTKGTYSQISASTGKDYAGIFFVMDPNNTAFAAAGANFYIDVAIGGAGSEKVIVPNYFAGNMYRSTNTCEGFGNSPSPFFPIVIPAGTRIAARAQSSIASLVFNLTVYGVYA